MLACSLAKSALLSSSMRPTSASVLTTAGRLNVTSSVVFTSPAEALASRIEELIAGGQEKRAE